MYAKPHSIQTILEYLEPFTKQKGIYLENKVVIEDLTFSNKRLVTVWVDIGSSFPNKEGLKIKAYLRNNGFQFQIDCYFKQFLNN